MNCTLCQVLLWLVGCGLATFSIPIGAFAQQPPSYANQVRPLLAKYCLECHNARQAKGEFVLESFRALQEGGKSGAAVVPGKPDESRLVLLVEGKDKPAMPPKNARQPSREEIAVLRAWVAAGARDDSAAVAVAIPDIKPRAKTHPPISALAYRPDGKLLAAGGHGEVTLIEVPSGDITGKLEKQTGRVTALSFSRDGRRLAVASGSPAAQGDVRLYAWPADGLAAAPEQAWLAHRDTIYDLAFSPDGRLLATCGYDRLIKLWDVPTGKEVRTLKDHSDAVYGLAFSPNGKLLASAAADRAVKVWDVSSGKRLYTLSEATDGLYAVSWHPGGKHLAAAGIDKSIRVWEVSATEGKLVQSVFAHEGPVTRLVHAADGTVLYSLSEDRTVKSWDASRMMERKVYPKQNDAILSLAVRPDHQQLALGRYDGALVLVDEAKGVVQAEPLPARPKPPKLTKLTPRAGRRGQTIRVKFDGNYLQGVTEIVCSRPGVISRILSGGVQAKHVEADVTFPADTPAGLYQLGLKGPQGESARLPFAVDLYEATAEKEPNDSPSTGQPASASTTIAGSFQRAGDVDYYRFQVRAGQEIGVQAVAAPGAKVHAVLLLLDGAGARLAESSQGFLGHAFSREGVYVLGIHDRDYGGGTGMEYRLHVGDIPMVSSVFPLGLERGTEAEIHLEGVHLGGVRSVRVKAPPNAAPGTRLPVKIDGLQNAPLGKPVVVVGEFPEQVGLKRAPATGANLAPHISLSVPGTGNGVLAKPGGSETWLFDAKKGQRLIVEVEARRLGSPLDSVIEIRDAEGRPVPRATLRCLAKTHVTFRDHDSAGDNIRIESWSQLAVNDYVWSGNELLRIKSLPTHPDADCIFFSDGGRRVGFLDTTPNYQPMGQPMYKVSLHPPGATFPPNGFPVITVFYRNDDGGPGYDKDSRLFFDPPADGVYRVSISDARGFGGSRYAYRLTLRPPRPSFKVRFQPTNPVVPPGGAVPVDVTAERLDGYDGEILLRLDDLPRGFTAPATSIPAGENTTSLALHAEADAEAAEKAPPFKLLARTTIHDQETVREVKGGTVKLGEPRDILTATEQSEISIRPGGVARLTVRIERRHGFKGRVPIEVRGLPHGVRVLDIGLNGILITEQETSRTMRLYAEPWVQATEHPIVVLAKHEDKKTEHAARSVLLKVTNP